ncbi:MAG: flagellar biosynthetic protein FliR [Acidobacteriaceae bacterium]|nr:flagellar biosynthetic protein FliR [Acidobacteriaceae bacterium]
MHGEISFSIGLIYSFLLVLARIGGAVVFVPLPGIRSAPEPIRVVLILGLTFTLFPVWPTVPATITAMEYAGWVAIEATFGLCIGLLVGFLADAALIFGQICGLQAGFSFASTVDPESQADAPVLSAIAQTVSALLFVTLGFHRYIIRLFAESLEKQPPGQLLLDPRWGAVITHAAGSLFAVGLRLALPVVGLMLMVDLTLALLGRFNAQLHLLHLTMPLKILAGLAAISALLMLFPSVYEEFAGQMFRVAVSIAR